MKITKSKIITLICMAILAVTILAVGIYFLRQEQSKPKKITGVREEVRLGYTIEVVSALILIAQHQNFFSDEGLDITLLKEYPSGKRSMEGMFAGEVDVSIPAETPVVFSSFKRQDFSIVATVAYSDNVPKIIARKDRGIQRPKDLRGKRIATQEASSVHYFLHLFLIKNGLSEKDIKLSFKKAEEMPQALAKGDIDAFSMREPFISQAKALLEDNAVIFQEQGLYVRTDHLVALNSLIKNKPEVINRMLKALVKAEKFAQKNPEKAIEIVSNKLWLSASEAAANLSEFDMRLSLEQSLLLSLEDEARWVIKNKLTDKTKVPNYLNFIYLDGLKAVKPEAITIIR